MKQVHASYSFAASTKTITLTGLNIDQDQLLLIVNATRGVQYFNFADSSLRAAVTPGANTSVVLTDASTTGHANGDALVIYYDDQLTGNVVSGTVTANPGTGLFTVAGTVGLDPASLAALENVTVTVGAAVEVSNFPASQVVTGSVAVTTMPAISISSVTVSNFPATQQIAGTVTANGGFIGAIDTDTSAPSLGIAIGFLDASQSGNFVAVDNDNPDRHFPVKIGGSLPAISGTVTVGNTVTVNQSGSVTVGANPSGALTTRFGSVTTANTSELTSCVTNTSRKYLLAQNISAGTVTIGIGFSPTTTQGIQLTAGAGLTFDAFAPTGAIYWLGAVTGANYCLIEG